MLEGFARVEKARTGLLTDLINHKQLPATIAVVICTHNRPLSLERCLERLREVEDPDFSIVVVDSAPKSCATKSVAARYNVQYEVSLLKGLSRARNIGCCTTRADIIAYLDDDMVPHPRWLASLVKEFSDKDVMAATGPVLSLELDEASGVNLRLALEVAPWGPHRFQLNRSSHQWFERANFGGIGDGNFALRRSVFEQIQGFDERLGRGAAIDIGEEHYAYFRIVDRGFKIAYCPSALVFHATSAMNLEVLRKQIADTTAFAAFLAWNHPSQSWRIVKFLAEGFLRARRWWRTSTRYQTTSLSVIAKMASALDGLRTFAASLGDTKAAAASDER